MSDLFAECCLVFHLPEVWLRFAPGDLDVWAEHLAWCLRIMGVPDGATIAVQDFGTSPLSFLGSALLMPTLTMGVAERLKGRFICLDASNERVTLTPAMVRQAQPQVLVVRADVLELLVGLCRKSGFDLASSVPLIIVATGEGHWPAASGTNWRYLLSIESALLLAPECPSCGCFHLRAGFYTVEGDLVRNLCSKSARPYRLRELKAVDGERCALVKEGWRIRRADE